MECNHFENCGGCYYSIPYQEQLKEKEQILHDIFGQSIQIQSSPVVNGYRQRIDYVYAFGKLGLRQQGNFREVVDIEDCKLISAKMNQLLQKIRELLQKHKIESYDYLKHQGYLRYVTMREAKFTNQLMVGFVTSSKNEEIKKVTHELEEADSIIWLVNDTKTDTSYGQAYQAWNNTIREDLDGIKLHITQNVFFQPNPYMAKEIFKQLREFVYGKTLELYCGIGTISLYIADKTDEITGVESVPEAIDLAKQNAELNSINAEFICEDSGKYLNNRLTVDTIIADPPRSGMGRKTCRKLLWKRPERIILMSCNPKTLYQDLQFLQKKYEIKYLKGFDMFPHTKHIECLCVLDRTQ